VPLTGYNLGVRGQTSSDVRGRWLDECGENLAAVVSGAASAGRPVLVVGPPPDSDPDQHAILAELDTLFGRVCADAGVTYVSVLEPLAGDAKWLPEVAAGDGARRPMSSAAGPGHHCVRNSRKGRRPERAMTMPKQIPCLWFDGQAEQAAEHYTSIFPNSSIGDISRYGPDMPPPMKEGDVMTVSFTLDGQDYVGLNGGPQFPFTEAISFQIMCMDQEEADHYWNRLLEGGEESQCGWLKDKFGVSWQVFPEELIRLTGDPDPGRAQRATQAMLQMRRIDIAEIRRAADDTSA